MSETPTPKVGDTIWFFDINRRVYRPDRRGGPIWREHWRPVKITGETARSFLTNWEAKCPKKGREAMTWAWSPEEIDRAEVVAHRHLIANMVHGCRDYATLVAVRVLLESKTDE